MNKYWLVFEKAAGIILVCISICILYLVTDLFSNSLEHLPASEVLEFYFNSDFGLWSILGLLGFVGGVLLLFNKKWGWLASIVIFFSYFVISSIISIKFLIEKNSSNASDDFWSWLLIGMIISSFLFLGILLTHNRFRRKYSAKKESFFLVAFLVMVVVADKLLIIG